MSNARPTIDLTKVSKTDLFPEGRHRARIAEAENRPKDTEFGPGGEVPGKFNDEGDPKYGFTHVGFVFSDHPSNFDVDPQTGKDVSIAGRWLWENFSWHPTQLRRLRELFDNSGTAISPEGIDPKPLVAKEVDVVIKNRPRRDDPEQKESRVVGIRVASDVKG